MSYTSRSGSTNHITVGVICESCLDRRNLILLCIEILVTYRALIVIYCTVSRASRCGRTNHITVGVICESCLDRGNLVLLCIEVLAADAGTLVMIDSSIGFTSRGCTCYPDVRVSMSKLGNSSIFIALLSARAFLVLQAFLSFGSCLVYYPLKLVRCYVSLIATSTLGPVIGLILHRLGIGVIKFFCFCLRCNSGTTYRALNSGGKTGGSAGSTYCRKCLFGVSESCLSGSTAKLTSCCSCTGCSCPIMSTFSNLCTTNVTKSIFVLI